MRSSQRAINKQKDDAPEGEEERRRGEEGEEGEEEEEGRGEEEEEKKEGDGKQGKGEGETEQKATNWSTLIPFKTTKQKTQNSKYSAQHQTTHRSGQSTDPQG